MNIQHEKKISESYFVKEERLEAQESISYQEY